MRNIVLMYVALTYIIFHVFFRIFLAGKKIFRRSVISVGRSGAGVFHHEEERAWEVPCQARGSDCDRSTVSFLHFQRQRIRQVSAGVQRLGRIGLALSLLLWEARAPAPPAPPSATITMIASPSTPSGRLRSAASSAILVVAGFALGLLGAAMSPTLERFRSDSSSAGRTQVASVDQAFGAVPDAFGQQAFLAPRWCSPPCGEASCTSLSIPSGYPELQLDKPLLRRPVGP